jgi:hypothetical protein
MQEVRWILVIEIEMTKEKSENGRKKWNGKEKWME